MGEVDRVEAALERLIPRGLSESGQREMNAVIDELAEDSSPVGTMASSELGTGGSRARWVGVGVAAAAVLGFWLARDFSPPASDVTAGESEILSGRVVLVSESNRVESMTDEGWSEYYDGAAMRTMRLSVVEENSFLDEETGIVIQVSEPREEVLLVPVSTF